MARRLLINGKTGKAFISDTLITDTAAETDPLSSTNIPHIYFHSELPYIQINQKITVNNITFPAVPVNSYDPPSSGGKCCFIMLEARYGSGILDSVVRRYRDENTTIQNKRGYYKLAEVLVPLMREYILIKALVIITFANPLVYYAKWYYGYNSWGWVFIPVKKLWMKVFDILGKDTQFIRENGEII